MRVYVGELDHDGRLRAWVAHEGERVDLAELVDVLGRLRALNDPITGPELDRDSVLARKQALIDLIEANGSLPAPVELVHRGTHSPEGFAWGYAGSGPSDLAQSILGVEVGEDLGPDVYLRFRDDVIARLPHRTHFRLTSADVGEWLSANRELVERAFLVEPPSAAVVAGDVDAPVPGDGTAEVNGPDSGATASAVVSACEAAWAEIRTHHPALPEAVMILGSGVERGRLVKLGHWWGGRWLADGQVRGEVLLAGEALHLPADQVFEVLLHEAAHGLNAAAGVKDTSRGGRYHNQQFAESARRVLLHVRATPPYGLAGTTLTPEARERYGPTIERLGEEIRIARTLGRGVVAGVEGAGSGGTGGGGAGREGDETGGKARGSLAASCGCGRKLRMAPSVLAKGPVLCGVCGNEFSAGAEVEAKAPERDEGREARAGGVGAGRGGVGAETVSVTEAGGVQLAGAPSSVEVVERTQGSGPADLAAGSAGRDSSVGSAEPLGESGYAGSSSDPVAKGHGRSEDAARSASLGAQPSRTGQGAPLRPAVSAIEPDNIAGTGGVPGVGVVDHSFVGRRSAVVERERRVSDLRGVVARQVAVLESALASASPASPPGLAPLRDRRARLGVVLEHLDRAASGAPAAPASTSDAARATRGQAEAVRLLAAEGGTEHRLAAWYDDLGTLRAGPMAAADAADAFRLTRLARAMLTAEGTLSGPEVEVDGRTFQAGDRVVALAEVPGGPPAGVPGTVVEADPDLDAVRVDFATWGTVRAASTSALGRSLDHDYAVVGGREAAAVVAGVEKEFERLGIGVEP